MNKTIIAMILAAIMAAATIFSGCSSKEAPAGGGGKVITEDRLLTDFSSVEVEGTFDVEINQSESYSITISADESLFDYVAVAKENSTLRVFLDPRHTFSDFTTTAKTLKARITMPRVSAINLSGATRGTASGFKSTANFRVVVSGASSLALDKFEVGDAEFEVSGASDVSGMIKANDAEFAVSGASQVKLSGTAQNAILSTSGDSRIDLINLPCNNAYVNLSGASEVKIHVKGRLDTVLSGASRLYFLGNPTMGNVSISGASTIKHE